MKEVRKLNFDHICIHATFQMLAGIVYGFGIYMLLQRGFDQATAGLCFSCINIVCLVLSPLVSNYLDRTKKVTLFDMLLFETILIAILFLCNMFITSKSIYLAIVMVLACGMYSSLEPIVNSLSLKFTSNGIPIEFGIARAVGSISYGSVCAIFGVLSNKFDYKVVLIGGFVFACLLTIASFVIRKDYYDLKIIEQPKEKKDLVSYKEFFNHHSNYIILCLFLVLIMAGYTGIDNFMLLVCENVGGTSADMGICLGFKAAVEALGMFLFAKLAKKFDLISILKISAISFVIKISITLFAKDISVIYISQLFQMISFGFIFPGMVKFVSERMNRYEAIRGQAFFTMTIGFGSMISSTVSGVVGNTYGTNALELACFIMAFIGAVGFIYFVNKQ